LIENHSTRRAAHRGDIIGLPAFAVNAAPALPERRAAASLPRRTRAFHPESVITCGHIPFRGRLERTKNGGRRHGAGT